MKHTAQNILSMFLNSLQKKGTTNKSGRRHDNCTPADSFLSFSKDIRNTQPVTKEWYEDNHRVHIEHSARQAQLC